MKNIVKSSGLGLSYILKDKWNLVFSLAPVAIGTILFTFLGSWLWNDVSAWGQDYINQWLKDGTFGTIAYYVMKALLIVGFYFIVNFGFVLVTSIIASPFNDLLSERVEKLAQNAPPPPLGDSFKKMTLNVFKIIFNELKKISFIVLLGVLAFVLNFIPALTPVSLLLSAVLVAIQFLDYSWSRHRWSFAECRSDLRQNLFSYLIVGIVILFGMAIPVVNVILLPISVSTFTVLWSLNHKERLGSSL